MAHYNRERSKHPVLRKFEEVMSKLDRVNGRGPRKFIPMTHGRGSKITDVGLYNTVTKRYALTDIRAFNALDVIAEMEEMLKAK